jgi:hypothetical protein
MLYFVLCTFINQVFYMWNYIQKYNNILWKASNVVVLWTTLWKYRLYHQNNDPRHITTMPILFLYHLIVHLMVKNYCISLKFCLMECSIVLDFWNLNISRVFLVKNGYKGNLTTKIDHFYWWSENKHNARGSLRIK